MTYRTTNAGGSWPPSMNRLAKSWGKQTVRRVHLWDSLAYAVRTQSPP
jgi:hypothetical protein